MSKLQDLKEIKKNMNDAKRLMFIHKPNRDKLGNQYNYWESEYKKFKKQYDNLKYSK